MKKKFRFSIGDLIPFIALLVVVVFFTILSGGKMLYAFNLKMILEQSILVMILGCGMLFVVAQGSIDLSVGVNLAVSGILANYIANVSGVPLLVFPCAIIFGALFGVLNGFLVSKCHVSSFLISIAMLIGLRGVANFLLTQLDSDSVTYLNSSLSFMSNTTFKYICFAVIIIVCFYIFEFTRVGYYSKAIGENETTARFVGIPVTKMKWIAFIISGLMAGVGALFSLAAVGGTSMQMGSFMEMKTAMAIFFGGVLVTGGSSAKFYKLILGAFTITIIINGLSISGYSATQISEFVEGALLLLILFLTIRANNHKMKAHKEESNKVTAEEQVPEKS